MSVELTELRVEQVDEAVVFVREHGGQALPANAVWPLSLLAKQGGSIVAVALCCRNGSEHRLDVVLDRTAQDPADLARLLVDKALLKVQARGIHKCAIRVLADEPDALLWADAAWTGTPEAPPQDAQAPEAPLR
jgi:hypothetical protein